MDDEIRERVVRLETRLEGITDTLTVIGADVRATRDYITGQRARWRLLVTGSGILAGVGAIITAFQSKIFG